MDNTAVIYLNLPTRIKGFVVHNNEDGYNTIVLNIRHSYFQNQQTLEHELVHINNDDFYNYMPVTMLEQIRHA